MKKIGYGLAAICCAAALTIGTQTTSAATTSTAPKITYKTYKTKDIQYAVIHNTAYQKVNAKMYQDAKVNYAYRQKLLKQYAADVKRGTASKNQSYVFAQNCSTAYKTKKKVSIACEVYEYTGGAHGYSTSVSYNTLNGKQLSLKNAFKSEAAYKAGKAYAKNYILSRPTHYPFADNKSTIAGHQYVWTKKGLNVQFDQYDLASYAEGKKLVPIPQKYVK
ncbi:PdaC/SigV domain-containing protein [Kurthia senegalensis]|uniref:PdaC/SigV domain-containing protein n=1 Tax=Kurthia senegalensis TaxID=1033740 RepID=UPI000289FD0A|nr:DUF4163 domain-containing protein [Kurthia senegalensis]